MSRVITFSRVFPCYHQRKGEPTYFVEKIVKSFLQLGYAINDIDELECDESVYDNCIPKDHTIRAGNRWKVGDKFSPRVWSGKPYNSKQITIAPDIEIKKIFNVEKLGGILSLSSNKKIVLNPLNKDCVKLAKNDGLTAIGLCQWFTKDFIGQIICWNEEIDY